MKTLSAVLKILTALATIAGAIYIIATYGDKIVEWAKKFWASLPCPCCEKDAAEEVCAEEVCEEPVAEEPAAEEVPAEEIPAEEVVVEAEEPVAEEPVAEEADFE